MATVAIPNNSNNSVNFDYPELELHPRALAGSQHKIEYHPGCTEPWVASLVSAFIVASGARTVLETGAFLGTTSLVIAETLGKMGGGRFTAVDIDTHRASLVQEKLLKNSIEWNVDITVIADDIMEVIKITPNLSLDLVWIDDDHNPEHVSAEIEALYPKMSVGGLMLLHDVFGAGLDLWKIVRAKGGYAIDLPKMGPAGGLGMIQAP